MDFDHSNPRNARNNRRKFLNWPRVPSTRQPSGPRAQKAVRLGARGDLSVTVPVREAVSTQGSLAISRPGPIRRRRERVLGAVPGPRKGRTSGHYSAMATSVRPMETLAKGSGRPLESVGVLPLAVDVRIIAASVAREVLASHEGGLIKTYREGSRPG
jgi:hypothetical protein